MSKQVTITLTDQAYNLLLEYYKFIHNDDFSGIEDEYIALCKKLDSMGLITDLAVIVGDMEGL
jgi:hypothetical protein